MKKINDVTILILAQLILIALKLCNVIAWSWAGVLIPVWIFLGLVLSGFLIGLFIRE